MVEELQVQILKLLLDNKDDNGVSGQDPCVGLWLFWALTPDSRAGLCSPGRAQGEVQNPQLSTAFFPHPLKGEASRYIFLTKFRKFLQENASGRGVGILQGGPCGLPAVLQGLHTGHPAPKPATKLFHLPLTSAAFPSWDPRAWPWMRSELGLGLAGTSTCFLSYAPRTHLCSAPLSTWSASCTGWCLLCASIGMNTKLPTPMLPSVRVSNSKPGLARLD